MTFLGHYQRRWKRKCRRNQSHRKCRRIQSQELCNSAAKNAKRIKTREASPIDETIERKE